MSSKPRGETAFGLRKRKRDLQARVGRDGHRPMDTNAQTTRPSRGHRYAKPAPVQVAHGRGQRPCRSVHDENLADYGIRCPLASGAVQWRTHSTWRRLGFGATRPHSDPTRGESMALFSTSEKKKSQEEVQPDGRERVEQVDRIHDMGLGCLVPSRWCAGAIRWSSRVF